MNRFLHIISILTGCVVCALLSSCSMIKDDVDDCPTGLFVRFVYDYNTLRADLFKDHVGHVTLYVYDEGGKLVATRSESNYGEDGPLSQYGFTFHFNPNELPAGKYRLQAVAMQKDWDEALATNGAKYRRSDVSHSQSLKITLDHAEKPIEGTLHHPVEHLNAPLDTLWHTLKVMSTEPMDGRTVPAIPRTKAPFSPYPMEEQYVTVADGRATYATVSLIRDTNHLNVTLRQIDDPVNVFDEDYEMHIVDRNAIIAHDNELEGDKQVRYTPFTAWTTRFDNSGNVIVETPESKLRAKSGAAAKEEASVLQRTAHYNVMFNRIMHPNSTADNSPQMEIRNKKTGKVVATMDLAKILAQGRTAFELYNYSPQEYLDREYDFHLDFLLKGDQWLYCDIVINSLSWSKRVQNEIL